MANYDGTKICNLDDSIQGARAGNLCKWAKAQPLTYLIKPGWTIFTQDDINRAFRIAFDRWEAVANLKFLQINAGTADITIRQERIDGPSDVLAEAQLPCGQTDFPLWARFDNSEDWVIADNPGNTKIDLIRVACHELGHSLGIGHIGASNLMAPYYSSSIKDPQVGDIAEAVSRYGIKPQEPSAPPQPPTGSDEYVLLKFLKKDIVFPE